MFAPSGSKNPNITRNGRLTHRSFPEPDMALITELMEHIDRAPPAPEARKILMEQYRRCGWVEAAEEQAIEVLKIDSDDPEALTCLGSAEQLKSCKAEGDVKGKGKATQRLSIGKGLNLSKMKSNSSQNTVGLDTRKWQPSIFPITSPDFSMQELEEGYVALLEKSRTLQHHMELLQNLKGMRPLISEQSTLDITALAQGRMNSFFKTELLDSAKDISEKMIANNNDDGNGSLDVAIKDLQNVARFSKSSREHLNGPHSSYDGDSDNDDGGLRDVLVRRVRALKSLLPSKLQPVADAALMHVEHETLRRSYVNDETMFGDALTDIPRESFWVSEDGYAWDMGELAQAITSGGGVMRNPLTKQLFTPADIRSILRHPEGERLAALQVKQSELKKGVRTKTIENIGELAKVLVEDMTEDQLPSRRAVEEFLAYTATLPDNEQKAIDELKIPAKDSHTNIAFDIAIGDAVRDAQGNRVCFHKTGDLLQQAANHLKK